MAAVTSLGVHTPVALPYLTREGILPLEPKRELYQWETYPLSDDHGEIVEEVLATRSCVVWSQGKFVRTIYRFELEGEHVVQALLTSFPTNTAPRRDSSGHHKSRLNSAGTTTRPNPGSTGGIVNTIERALVVLLKTKAHVYFLHGAHHIVDLPFEVERAFPAPRGIILQRKFSRLQALPPTPKVPAAPPTSFFSSQVQPSSSYLQSPTLIKSFASSQSPRPSPIGAGTGGSKLEALFQDVIGSPGRLTDDDTASLYSLTSPLSKLGVLTFSLQHHKPRLSSKMPGGLSVEFETLDPIEEVIYVSVDNELRHKMQGSLFLIVTANSDLGTVTVWHAWYIEEKSLSSLLKQRAARKAAKARRRSSFLSANLATGATTPVVRHREGPRASFLGDVAAPQSVAPSKKPTRQEEEDAFASQMDPDYQPAGSQQPPKESRRISSLVSRGELSSVDPRASQNSVGASFGGPSGRRNHSFGGPAERRSLGHRKSRGSTPGSMFSQTLGVDDTMDLDEAEVNGDESVDSIVRHIRATYEAAGVDSILGSADGAFIRELLVRKVASFSPTGQQPEPSLKAADRYKVATLREPQPSSDREDEELSLYVHDHSTKEVQCTRLSVKSRALWPMSPISEHVAVPISLGETKLHSCADILRLSDGNQECLLLSGLGIIFSPGQNLICPLPPPETYRIYDPLDMLSQMHSADKDVGRNRALQAPIGLTRLQHPGADGSFDEVADDGTHHRRRLQLRHRDSQIAMILGVCQTVLQPEQVAALQLGWCVAHAVLVQRPELRSTTAASIEWIALVTAVFANVLDLLDAKAKAALTVSKLAAHGQKGTESETLRLRKRQGECQLQARAAWSWMDYQLSSQSKGPPSQASTRGKDQLLPVAVALAIELVSQTRSSEAAISSSPSSMAVHGATKLMLGLHIYREELKLDTISTQHDQAYNLAPIIAQLGAWLGLDAWSFREAQYFANDGAGGDVWSYVMSNKALNSGLTFMKEPLGVYEWFESVLQRRSNEPYLTLAAVAQMYRPQPVTQAFCDYASSLTPRIATLVGALVASDDLSISPDAMVKIMQTQGLQNSTLETLPEAITAPFKEAVVRCEKEPSTTWSADLLRLVGREDLVSAPETTLPKLSTTATRPSTSSTNRDIQTISHTLEDPTHPTRTREAGRHAVCALIFSEDRRLLEATISLHFSGTQVAQCPKQPDWDDAQHFEHQRRVMQWVTLRMIALPPGDGMMHFDSETPLMTEKYHLLGFSSSCRMQPMGHTVTTDRSGLTEEKVNWAYFHAGVAAGLRISRSAKGIDTSWLVFNKPNDLTNRHAGLLLALGLGGHLRSLAKWLSFKYLTPKHTMTSVGLLLGISASYMGTMDSLIARMLSVHITRMLPSGAAELNVSPTTQTAGLMGIGLLYYNTQHRRMTEIMLSEIERMEVEIPDNGPDMLRDESYRLAAGFALGFINLSKGKYLRGLHGMQLPERLLAVAVGPRPINAVHVFDKATAGAIIAVALVYMKSDDAAIARKVDIPDTEAQFDQVRPDMLMLRTMAKQIIMWDDLNIEGAHTGALGWIDNRLPTCYRGKARQMSTESGKRHPLKSSDVPFFNVCTGLAWALSLRYAGSGNEVARGEILALLDYFHTTRSRADAYFYDAKLARACIRRCIDVLALSAATIMAGTGDLTTFRYLRRLHGRTDAETSYGSHMAAHLATGVLFLGGGMYTLGTSDLAVAAMMCAFYPLFPTDVHDNRVHLQAFRHFWVFAADARCLVVEDVDTHRPIHMPIAVRMRAGETRQTIAPCILPELDTIATLHSDDPAYWRVTLDFVGNADHLAAFRRNQRIKVRRCPAAEAHRSTFTATLAALNDSQSPTTSSQIWDWVFKLSAFRDLDKADIELILPPDVRSSVHTDDKGTVVDDRLTLSLAAGSQNRNALWNLRMLFAWAERARATGDERLRWIGREIVDALRARVEERMRVDG